MRLTKTVAYPTRIILQVHVQYMAVYGYAVNSGETQVYNTVYRNLFYLFPKQVTSPAWLWYSTSVVDWATICSIHIFHQG